MRKQPQEMKILGSLQAPLLEQQLVFLRGDWLRFSTSWLLGRDGQGRRGLACDLWPIPVLFLQGEERAVVAEMVQSPGNSGPAQMLDVGTSLTARPLKRYSGSLLKMKTTARLLFPPPEWQKYTCSITSKGSGKKVLHRLLLVIGCRSVPGLSGSI